MSEIYHYLTFRLNLHFVVAWYVKELLPSNKHNIQHLIDCHGTSNHNHLVCKQSLNHLAKLETLFWSSLQTGRIQVSIDFEEVLVFWLINKNLVKLGIICKRTLVYIIEIYHGRVFYNWRMHSTQHLYIYNI